MAEGDPQVGSERYTDSALRCILGAQEAARERNSPTVGVDHLLLGVLAEPNGGGAEILASFGVSLPDLEQIVPRDGSGADPPGGHLPFTPACKELLDLSLREALLLGSSHIGSEHLLLGLVEVQAPSLARLLDAFEIEMDAVRQKALRVLASTWQPPRDPAGPEQHRSTDGGESEDPEREIEAVPTHQDRPATEDELGRERLAEVLGERIRRVRGEDTEAPVGTWRQRRAKRRRDARSARQAGPFMVHVYAPWGAGKSSLLNFLAGDLRNRLPANAPGVLARAWRVAFSRRPPLDPRLSRWVVVRFSAWEHQRLAPPWWWLLAEIQRSCRKELWRIDRTRWARFWLWDVLWRLWNARAAIVTVLIVAAVVAAGFLTDWLNVDVGSLSALQAVALTLTSLLALAGTLAGLARGAGRWLAIGTAGGADRLLRRAHDPLGIYQRRFRWLVRSSGHPIAVFVDDLDRCRTDYVVELLEGIQTLLVAEPVTFVVAADRDWLCRSFETTYSDFGGAIGEPGRPLGFLFLEKTFQISLEIPPMTTLDRQRYWRALMRSPGAAPRPGPGKPTPDPEVDFRSARTEAEVEERLQATLRSGRRGDAALAAAMRRLNAPDMQEQLERLLGVFAPLLENNPRAMKRFMNAYGIERDRLLREGRLLTIGERRELALLTILRVRWPLLADHLRSVPGDAALCLNGRAPDGHPFAAMFEEADLRRLFDGSEVEERLDADLLTQFPRGSTGPEPRGPATGKP